jgi:ATP-dependent protease ClpP protease subunit
MAMELTLDDILAAVTPKGLPDVILYQYYKNLANRKIVINEQIGDGLIESAVLPFMEMNNDGSGKPIEIILSTLGGEIYNGFSLVDQIEKAKSPVIIHVMAIAASMGLLIAMAGKNNPNVKTVCHPFSVGLLHSGSQYMEGSAHAVKDTFDFSQHYEEKIKEYILSHTAITEDLYDKIERKEYWMDATEMKRLNIVDEII